MSNRFGDWLDARLGYRTLVASFRQRTLPDGPSWWYTSAGCLFWLLVIQGVTGLLLMATYSPSMTSAWASVHFIDQSAAGRFLRGVHHYTSHAMIILLAVHVARVLVSAAFRAPRELIWITGLLLFPLMIVWTVTGNPLKGSQTGMAQIAVEGNILGATPVIGPPLQRLLIGGDEVGNLTLTHLYFLHVGLLPVLVLLLAGVHLQQVFRHSIRAQPASDVPPVADAAHGPVPYWPHQTVRNMTVLAALVGVIAWLAWSRGAPLAAPADPDLPQSPRPEWYFRWLFELRRYFTGDREFIATIILPMAILAFFLLVPLLDRWLPRRTGLVFRVVVLAVSAGGWGWLSYTSFSRDWSDPEYLATVAHSQELAERAVALADVRHVGVRGAAVLLQEDPKTQGPVLFRRHCANCHSHTDANGDGIPAQEPSAPNLYGFGSAEWIEGMLDPERIVSKNAFGATAFAEGDMTGAVQDLFDGAEEDGVEELRANLRLVAQTLAAEGRDPSETADVDLERGHELLTEELGCTDCHRFGDEGDLGSAPDLTAYGSRDWLIGMISNPNGERYYPDDLNDRMPAYAEHPDEPESNLLSAGEVALLADWLRGEWFEPGK